MAEGSVGGANIATKVSEREPHCKTLVWAVVATYGVQHSLGNMTGTLPIWVFVFALGSSVYGLPSLVRNDLGHSAEHFGKDAMTRIIPLQPQEAYVTGTVDRTLGFYNLSINGFGEIAPVVDEKLTEKEAALLFVSDATKRNPSDALENVLPPGVLDNVIDWMDVIVAEVDKNLESTQDWSTGMLSICTSLKSLCTARIFHIRGKHRILCV